MPTSRHRRASARTRTIFESVSRSKFQSCECPTRCCVLHETAGRIQLVAVLRVHLLNNCRWARCLMKSRRLLRSFDSPSRWRQDVLHQAVGIQLDCGVALTHVRVVFLMLSRRCITRRCCRSPPGTKPSGQKKRSTPTLTMPPTGSR